jgi:polyphosphate glucokinase
LLIPSPTARLTGRALGLDIGGTGIKGAVVDVGTGRLVTDRIRLRTPHRATSDGLLAAVVEVVERIRATGAVTPEMPFGVGFPSVVKDGVALTATQLDDWWVGAPVQEVLEARLARPVEVMNDADAAAVGEIAYGAGKGQGGVVLLLALGTGIGTSLFVDGQLIPNLQLGHIEFHRRDAETRLSSEARRRRGLGLKRWAREFNDLLAQYETYLWPDLIILGGGMAKKFAKFGPLLKTRAPLRAASLGNAGGIVGAARVARYARERQGPTR